jgi:hypothetical protein
LQRGHDTEGDCRNNALELAHLAEEAEEAKGPQDPQLLDPAVGPSPDTFILGPFYKLKDPIKIKKSSFGLRILLNMHG